MDPPFRIVQPEEHYRKRVRRDKRRARVMVGVALVAAAVVLSFIGFVVYAFTSD